MTVSENSQAEIENGDALNEAWNALRSVVARMTGPMTIREMVERACSINMKNGKTIRNSRTLNATGVKNAIKKLIEKKSVVRLDADVLCPPDKIPRFRSLDDPFTAYVKGSERPPEPQVNKNIPSKNEVIESALLALRKVNLVDDRFRMDDFAATWCNSAPKNQQRNLKAIFAACDGKDAFVRLLMELERQGYIEALWATQLYYINPKASLHKPPKYRSLDDDWQ